MLNNLNLKKQFKILFIGDIVGRPGRQCVKQYLIDDNKRNQYDFIIANVENASHGFGLTKKNHDELLTYGINAMTSGNHIWDKKDIYSYINESDNLIRPFNYSKVEYGVGYKIFDNIIVINLLGRTFMPPIDCPFDSLEKIICELKNKNTFENKIIFIDFHAEATAEKQCFARYAGDLGISAVVGTHTHVQTADEKIFNNKCAYLTDVGFCGSKDSIIGMEYQSSLRRLTTSINERFEIDTTKPYILNACEIEFENNVPISINRINVEYDFNIDEDVKDEN